MRTAAGTVNALPQAAPCAPSDPSGLSPTLTVPRGLAAARAPHRPRIAPCARSGIPDTTGAD